MALNYKDIVHPEDENALRQLKNTTGVQTLAEQIVHIQAERIMHHGFMADCIKISAKQLPHLYDRWMSIVDKFGIPEPDFFLEQNPTLNAMTAGDKKPFIVVNSALIESLTPDELDSIIAHECGHILCRHCLYKTVLQILRQLLSQTGKSSVGIPGLSLLTGPILTAAYYAANYWSRRAEFSADRAAVVYTGNPEIVKKALLRVHGGPLSITENINMDAYVEQSEEFDENSSETAFGKLLTTYLVMDRSHPFGTERIKEIIKWGNSAQYRMVLENLSSPSANNKAVCPNCTRNVESDWKFCRHCGQKLI